MPTLFSKSSAYAIQATLFLSSRDGETPTLVREISMALGIPHPFLSKILQKLVRDGILTSHRGVSGGFSLARPSSEITLEDIVLSIDGKVFSHDCMLGFPWCTETDSCVVHDRLSSVKDIMESIVKGQTISHLSREVSGRQRIHQQIGIRHDE